MKRAKYFCYLQSRQWKFTRLAVMDRSNRICERCQKAMASEVHHFTYERLGDEHLDDLAALCDPCHAWLSATGSTDPITKVFMVLPETASWLFTQCNSYTQLSELWEEMRQ